MIRVAVESALASASAARVALLADTFHEVNGAARTCREWQAFAGRKQVPFLSVHWGRDNRIEERGSVHICELARSRWSFPIDTDLHFDVRFLQVLDRVRAEVERFRPDFIHVTSPGDLGILGAMLAAKLQVPLALSWHTSLHEFAARRMSRATAWLPEGARETAAGAVERFVMDRVCRFFGRGEVLFAPNPELIAMLRQRTGKPVFLMGRGVDGALFHPGQRTRRDGDMVLGFVGRLMPEKNLRLLARVAECLHTAGVSNVRFQITGEGTERAWLEKHLPDAIFTGVLTGVPLARAYANMDVFVFPSHTDTFGNVVQEAMASGVPAVATSSGGPRFIVRNGVSGMVAPTENDFCDAVVMLARDLRLRNQMGSAGRQQMEGQSWDEVFERVYEGYASVLERR